MKSNFARNWLIAYSAISAPLFVTGIIIMIVSGLDGLELFASWLYDVFGSTIASILVCLAAMYPMGLFMSTIALFFECVENDINDPVEYIDPETGKPLPRPNWLSKRR